VRESTLEGTLAVKRIRLIIIYTGLVVLAYVYKDNMLQWLQNGDTSSLPYAAFLATFIALVPIVPFGVVSGMLGAKYGAVIGGGISAAGSTIAAIVMFLMARYSFRERARQYIHRFKQLDRFTRMYEQNQFISILFARLIPIIPAAAVNIYSAISKVSLISFVTATAIGKMPVMLVFAVMGDQFLGNPKNMIYTGLIYVVFLGGALSIYRMRIDLSNK
jgi:uncharacterized membrane protein YdjX (TVP38/TMEM64 family)